MVLINIKMHFKGHFALYDLCDHNRWRPAVTPKPDIIHKSNPKKKQKLYFITKHKHQIKYYYLLC